MLQCLYMGSREKPWAHFLETELLSQKFVHLPFHGNFWMVLRSHCANLPPASRAYECHNFNSRACYQGFWSSPIWFRKATVSSCGFYMFFLFWLMNLFLFYSHKGRYQEEELLKVSAAQAALVGSECPILGGDSAEVSMAGAMLLRTASTPSASSVLGSPLLSDMPMGCHPPTPLHPHKLPQLSRPFCSFSLFLPFKASLAPSFSKAGLRWHPALLFGLSIHQGKCLNLKLFPLVWRLVIVKPHPLIWVNTRSVFAYVHILV